MDDFWCTVVVRCDINVVEVKKMCFIQKVKVPEKEKIKRELCGKERSREIRWL